VDLFGVAGKLALVTGSSRGIGLGLARGLLDGGCAVILSGRSQQTLESLRTQLSRHVRAAVHTVAMDVTEPDSVHRAMESIERDIGPLDIVVNNVGVQHRAPFTEFALEDWNRLIATNLTSAFLVGQAAAQQMAPRGRGKIINICSVQSEASRPGIAPYAATKGGLKMLTRGMCADLAGSGIQVNAIGPGYITTELTAPLVADEQFSAWIERRTPAGRWGEVEDLVGALVFFASPASDFVNGQILYVDGGMLSVL
jgi:gluconate 5-dehydrogenase